VPRLTRIYTRTQVERQHEVGECAADERPRLGRHLTVECQPDEQDEDVRHQQHRLDRRLAVSLASTIGGSS
jgi:hypothetical protein